MVFALNVGCLINLKYFIYFNSFFTFWSEIENTNEQFFLQWQWKNFIFLLQPE